MNTSENRSIYLGNPYQYGKNVVHQLSVSFNFPEPHVFKKRFTQAPHMTSGRYRFGEYGEPGKIYVDSLYLSIMEIFYQSPILSRAGEEYGDLFWRQYLSTLCHEFYHYLDEPEVRRYGKISPEKKRAIESSAEHFAKVTMEMEFDKKYPPDDELKKVGIILYKYHEIKRENQWYSKEEAIRETFREIMEWSRDMFNNI